MNIGKIIRDHRKEMGLTQEDMASRLGVTTPAVNKWENGNALPDISLLVPIARLLGITTDELLSFKGDISDTEIDIFIKGIHGKLRSENYEDIFREVQKKVKEYPNNENLKWKAAIMLCFARLHVPNKNREKYDKVVCSWLSQLLKSEDDNIRRRSAEYLFGVYYGKGDYKNAEKCLEYIPEDSFERKLNQANLCAKTKSADKAYVAYESLLLEEVMRLQIIIYALQAFGQQEENYEFAHAAADTGSCIAKCFGLGPYQENHTKLELAALEKDVEETVRIMKILFKSCDSILDYQKSKLFSHLEKTNYSKESGEKVRATLEELFRDEKSFDYMKGNSYWESVRKKLKK